MMRCVMLKPPWRVMGDLGCAISLRGATISWRDTRPMRNRRRRSRARRRGARIAARNCGANPRRRKSRSNCEPVSASRTMCCATNRDDFRVFRPVGAELWSLSIKWRHFAPLRLCENESSNSGGGSRKDAKVAKGRSWLWLDQILKDQYSSRDVTNKFGAFVMRFLFPRVSHSPSFRQSCQIHRARNQADVAERLREVAEESAARRVYLFGQQSDRIGSIAERMEKIDGIIQPSLISQIIRHPEAAEQKRAFAPHEAVWRDVWHVAVQQAAARAQPFGYRGSGRHHFGVVGRDDAAQRQAQQTGVEAAAAQMLRKRIEPFVPGFVEYRRANLLSRRAPWQPATRQFKSFDHLRPAVERHLAHGGGVCERPSRRAHLPDAVIRGAPLTLRVFDQLTQPFPQRFVDHAVASRPLVSAIENLAVDVMLGLLRRSVAPADRARAAIAFRRPVRLLRRGVIAVEVIERSGALADLDRVQRPTEERRRFLRTADAVERVNGERRVTHPGVTVVPVAPAADHFRQRRGRRRHDCAVLEMVEQLERQRRTAHDIFLRPSVYYSRRPAPPGVARRGERVFRRQRPVSADDSSPTQRQNQTRAFLEIHHAAQSFRLGQRERLGYRGQRD